VISISRFIQDFLFRNATLCSYDVVYNHTLSAGPTDGQSVLDKVVPGYYHRRNMDGGYEVGRYKLNSVDP
jgi:hypothetical protein